MFAIVSCHPTTLKDIATIIKDKLYCAIMTRNFITHFYFATAYTPAAGAFKFFLYDNCVYFLLSRQFYRNIKLLSNAFRIGLLIIDY